MTTDTDFQFELPFYTRDLSTPGEAIRFANELARYVLATYVYDDPAVTIAAHEDGTSVCIHTGVHDEPWHVEIQTHNGGLGSVWDHGNGSSYSLEPDPAIAFGQLTTLHDRFAAPGTPARPVLTCPACVDQGPPAAGPGNTVRQDGASG